MELIKLYVRQAAEEAGLETTGVLTFRPLGKVVKGIIIQHIEALPPQSVLELDFDGVDICDVSFVDEIVIEVQIHLLRTDGDKIFMVTNLSDATLENLEAALSVRDDRGARIQILQRLKDGKLVTIGKLERNLHEAFMLLADRRKLTARDIAELNEIAINSASNRLKKLFDQRLVLREEVIDSSGKQHMYLLP